jgi:hypothetical protein
MIKSDFAELFNLYIMAQALTGISVLWRYEESTNEHSIEIYGPSEIDYFRRKGDFCLCVRLAKDHLERLSLAPETLVVD